MKKKMFLVALLSVSSHGFAGIRPDETIIAEPCGVGCTDDAIFNPGSGGSGGGSVGGGGTTPSGGGADGSVANAEVDQAEKVKQNKDEKQKAKEKKSLFSKFRTLLSDAFKRNSVNIKLLNVEDPSGLSCTELDIGIGTDIEPGTCLAIIKSKQPVKLDNGQMQDMTRIDMTVVDKCYLNGGCPLTTFSFVAADGNEFDAILNEIVD